MFIYPQESDQCFFCRSKDESANEYSTTTLMCGYKAWQLIHWCLDVASRNSSSNIPSASFSQRGCSPFRRSQYRIVIWTRRCMLKKFRPSILRLIKEKPKSRPTSRSNCTSLGQKCLNKNSGTLSQSSVAIKVITPPADLLCMVIWSNDICQVRMTAFDRSVARVRSPKSCTRRSL